MKKLLCLLSLTGCVSTGEIKNQANLIQIGATDAKIKSTASIDLEESDWKEVKELCVTHLYQCDIDAQGAVTGVKALDLSAPAFKDMTEESLRAWRFEPGKAQACFAEFIYEKNQVTRILFLSETVAKELQKNFEVNRAAVQPADGKPIPTALRQTKPKMPMELVKKGGSAYALLDFDIDPAGVPQNIRILASEPGELVDKASLEAIKDWRYETLEKEPQSSRHTSVHLGYQVGSSSAVSNCDLGLKPYELTLKAAAN